ncbi:glycoside hydrolase [Entophlyctis helioformis]|nr:glycoside hydrolase [Entophlyctis helioformis]
MKRLAVMATWLATLALALALCAVSAQADTADKARRGDTRTQQQQKQQQQRHFKPWPRPHHQRRLNEYKLKVQEMYYHSLENYLEFAYPKDELQPLSCKGINSMGNLSLTLIDALDTAMIMNDHSTFIRMTDLVQYIDFGQDVNVSVFETNIRVLGGLLSAHVMAMSDPAVALVYNGILLTKAEEIGRKLLLAFNTPTGLPYGTVNLRNGVNKGESTVVCTACAGTFSLEFSWLSLLTGDDVFEVGLAVHRWAQACRISQLNARACLKKAARRAMHALWKHRSEIELFGNHIDVMDGRWIYKECSIGGGVDSFFEYLYKTNIAFSDEQEYGRMFKEVYRAIKIYMRKSNVHVDVHYSTGHMTGSAQWSLGTFWPSVKILAGDVIQALEDMLPTAYYLWKTPFLPEIMHADLKTAQDRLGYPLRPEFVESMWYLYRATGHDGILDLAFDLVDRLNRLSRTPCGFANIANVATLAKEDKMESFFLAETIKYLYLLFDTDNEYNVGNYVFNTEAHPFPVMPSYKTGAYLAGGRTAVTAASGKDAKGKKPFMAGYKPAKILEHAAAGYAGDDADFGLHGMKVGMCSALNWQYAQIWTASLWPTAVCQACVK